MAATIILTPWQQASAFDDAGLAGRLVITPNSRAAAALGVPKQTLENLAREALSALNLAIAPPLPAQRLLREAAITTLHSSDPAGAARTIAPVLKELFRAGADLESIARTGSPRAARIAHLGLSYREKLRAAGWVDAAEAMTVAASQILPKRDLLVHGYPRLGRDERAFLEAIAGPNTCVRLPYANHPVFKENLASAQQLAAAGWHVEHLPDADETTASPFADFASRGLQAIAHVYPTMEDEVRGVLASVKALLVAGTPASDIAIVARDDAFYGPLVEAVGWEYGVPVRALYAVPLADTRVGAWVRLLIEAVRGGLPFEPTFRLLNHPIGEGLYGEPWIQARKLHPVGLEAWGALGIGLDWLNWPEAADRLDWVARFEGILQSQDARGHAARWPREMLAFNALRDALAMLASLGPAITSREEFCQELDEVMALASAPAQPGRGGVELHTPLSLYGARYQHLFVVGMAEDVLPAPVIDSPVLDFHERALIASAGCEIEDAAGAARREVLSFIALLQVPAERLTLSYPRLLGGRAALPSPYLRALGLAPTPATDRPTASLEEARQGWLTRTVPRAEDDRVLPHARAAHAVELRREGSEAADAFDGIVGLPFDLTQWTFSATQLVTIGQCAFKWYARYALGLLAPEEGQNGLEPGMRGQLYHKTLELGLKRVKAEPDPRSALLLALDGLFRDAEVAVGLPALPGWEARRIEHLAVLRRAIAAPDFFAEGSTVLALEAPFAGEWHGLKVKGFVDRVDREPAGLVLIDYKTSGTPPSGACDAEGKAKRDLQLPIYWSVAAPAIAPGEPVERAYYYSLTKAKVLAKVAGEDPTLAEWAGALKERLKAGAYPVQPDVDGKACQYCDAAIVCRRGPRLARKEVTR